MLEGFKVNLKTFFGLAMPNQYCQTVVYIGNMRLVFWIILLGRKSQTTMIPNMPYYRTV